MHTANDFSPLQPATTMPFLPGQAIWYEPSNHSMTKPYLPQLIPAVILDCERDRPFARARICRLDKTRPTRVGARGLAYRGYCEACEVPAIQGEGDRLICPECLRPAAELPPPVTLTAQWFPVDDWQWPMTIRHAAEHPDWNYWAARHAADHVVTTALEGTHARLGLPKRLARSGERWIGDYHALKALDFYAVLGDDAGFQVAYERLRHLQEGADDAEIRTTIERLFGDQLPPPRLVFLPIDIERVKDDSEPDGEDETTTWLRHQFRRRAA
jgi:hypothetical protein